MPQTECPGFRLQDLVAALAHEGRALRWDAARGWYEVLDGPLFEARFDAHRRKRNKRRGSAPDRPFGRMHFHFKLVRGERWAGTGSAFRPISARCRPAPPQPPVCASFDESSSTLYGATQGTRPAIAGRGLSWQRSGASLDEFPALPGASEWLAHEPPEVQAPREPRRGPTSLAAADPGKFDAYPEV